jgi:C2 domain
LYETRLELSIALARGKALRPRIGRLTVSVRGCEGLSLSHLNLGVGESAGEPFIRAALEHQTAYTPPLSNGRRSCPAWDDGTATFTFAVTDIGSDLVLGLMERDNVLGDRLLGEVILLLCQLLKESPLRVKLRGALGPRLAR